MKIALRDYQQEAHGAVIDAISNGGYKSVLVTSATGTGKSVLFAALIKTFLDDYKWKGLVLAPRRELIGQAYKHVRNMCDLREEYNEIDKEMGSLHFDNSALVVIGSIQTCYKPTRLKDWTPDFIIVDEAHFVMADTYKQLFDRFPDCVKIGVTATAMRGDRQPVFHEHIDGRIFNVEDPKTGKTRPSMPEECGFIKHVYDYPLEDAVNDGWLVEPRGYAVESGVDISSVKTVRGTSGDSDFSQTQLNAALSADQKIVTDRINRAITKWKEVASERPTIVFCPSVEYSHWAADLWKQAGFSAAAIDCNTDEITRDRHIGEIHAGNVQVTTNFGIYTHGTDVDKWSCIVLLRPTESNGLLCQMLGRVTRPLDAVGQALGGIATAQDRKALIAKSGKPDSIVIDVVDIVGKHKIATLPTALGLPANLDLQGRKLTDAAALVNEFDEVKDQVMYTCPATYEELEASLREISILTQSGAKSRDKWMVRDDGTFQFGKAPPGYTARLSRIAGDTEQWKLTVVATKTGEVLVDRTAPRTQGSIDDYFDSAATRISNSIDNHRKENPKTRGTMARILQMKDGGKGTLYHLRKAGFTDTQIDALGWQQLFAIVTPLREKYWQAKAEREQAQQGVAA